MRTSSSNENTSGAMELEEGCEFSDRQKTVVSVLSSKEPPTLWQDITGTIKEKVNNSNGKSKSFSLSKNVSSTLRGIFPILKWGASYNLAMFKSDFMAGLTLASLGIPQVRSYILAGRTFPSNSKIQNPIPCCWCRVLDMLVSRS